MPPRRRRSARISIKPQRWEPHEEVVDDFKPAEYDTDDDSDVSSTVSLSDGSDEEPDSGDEEFIARDSEPDEMYEDEESSDEADVDGDTEEESDEDYCE